MKLPLILSLALTSILIADTSIQSIVLRENLVSADESLSHNTIDIQLPCNKEELEASLEPFIGLPMTEENLQNLKDQISKTLANQGDGLRLVEIPEQLVANGKLQIIAAPACIDEISICGNRWFSANSIAEALSFYEGDVANEDCLLNTAAWLNRNPFIHTDLVLVPGKVRGTTDIQVLVKDRLPARFYAGTDNTGNSFSGDERFYVGGNFSLGLRNLLTYQFTSSYDFPEFLSHLGNWTIFFPWEHEMAIYGGYATIHPSIDDFESSGRDVQVSMRYTIPFKPLYTPFQQQLVWGADFKETDSALFFVGTLPSGVAVRIPQNDKTAVLFQFYLGYQLEKTWENLSATFQWTNQFSPFTFLPHQNETDYNSLRPGANTRYYYAKMAGGLTYTMCSKWEASGLVRTQVASGALLPTEMFGLGGFDTVRGYQERVFLSDNCVIGNFEIRAPALNLPMMKRDSLQFLAFLDTAYGYNWKTSEGYLRDAWLMGIGPGMRYQVFPYFTARLDYGFRIHNVKYGNGQLGRVHFSAVLSY